METRAVIAVVDDEEKMRIALRRFLRTAGLEVETFASGAEFLASLADHQLACVVLDLNMPQPDGLAVQARLTESGIRLPVVVVTARDTAEWRERALAGGASAYLQKPVGGNELLDAIRRAIAGGGERGAGSGNQ
jgi:two-component system, LuxR family, response regulator FixJ